MSEPNRRKRPQTYGGLPVDDEYLARYGVMSDQDVYSAIAIGSAISLAFVAVILVVLWVLS